MSCYSDNTCRQSCRDILHAGTTGFGAYCVFFRSASDIAYAQFGKQVHVQDEGAAHFVEMPKVTIARSYLAAYNTAQAAGWATALYYCVSSFWSADGYATVYENTNAVVSRYTHHLMSV